MRLWPRKKSILDLPEPEPIRRKHEHAHRHEVTHTIRHEPKPRPHEVLAEAVSSDGRIYRFSAHRLYGQDGELQHIDLGGPMAVFGEQPVALRLVFRYGTDRL